jgi:hypothetical protein
MSMLGRWALVVLVKKGGGVDLSYECAYPLGERRVAEARESFQFYDEGKVKGRYVAY